ncbi:MAG TPA: mechanosensitive ion channel domain-containing protein, partial [Longimicrobiales bacterium]|nr:mechanosensitive ion channel domain-containing protein [Longimicrobiales bacterium]
RLRRFRQGTLLAVAVTTLFLLLWGVADEVPAQEQTTQDTIPATVIIDTAAVGSDADEPVERDPARSAEEAAGTLRELVAEFVAAAPVIVMAIGILLLAALLVRSVRFVLRRVLGQWERANAATAMSGVIIWIVAVGTALSLIAGDARALIGSVGLLGLALSWALQAPIESFAGWLVNSFKGYYRVGDRIGVGEVFGDVYRIDVLNTTVWEAGGPDKPVQGAQPTGAMITFPNSELLRANVVNYTRKFPYVWDEVVITISKESDLAYAFDLIGDVARRVIGPSMAEPVARYRALLEKEGLGLDIAEEPQLFVSQVDSWNEITVRYLVSAWERRRWASALVFEIETELARKEHAAHLQAAYPVRRLERRSDPDWMEESPE